MSILNDIGNFLFGWLVPDPPAPPKPAGVDVKLDMPREEPLIYGHVFGVSGEVVN